MSGSDGFDELFAADGGEDIAAVLDSAETLQARDPGGALWSLATAGAQIRLAVTASSAWLDRLTYTDHPRSILVTTDQHAGHVGELLVELSAATVPILLWQRPELPRWAGPTDVLLAASIDGMHPRVAALAAEADRRGLEVVLVAPVDSPVSAGAGRAVRVDVDSEGSARAISWALAAPLLLAAAAVRATDTTADVLLGAADAVDALARRSAPATATYANEAKQLAIDLAEAVPVLLGCGRLPSLAARRGAAALRAVAGVGALALELPDRLEEALALARSGGGSTQSVDFFRDRVDTPAAIRRLITLSPPPILPAPERAPGGLQEEHDDVPDVLELATARSAAAVRAAAERAGVRYSEVVPEAIDPLAAYAEQSLLGEFVAAYVALGTGMSLAGEGRAP